jgi:hypothetical protein
VNRRWGSHGSTAPRAMGSGLQCKKLAAPGLWHGWCHSLHSGALLVQACHPAPAIKAHPLLPYRLSVDGEGLMSCSGPALSPLKTGDLPLPLSH